MPSGEYEILTVFLYRGLFACIVINRRLLASIFALVRLKYKESRCISGRYPAAPGKYSDFNARNCDERSVGISDPGVTGQVLVKVHWELCDLFCDKCRWADWGAA